MAVQQWAHVLSAAGPRVLVVESDARTAAMARRCLERAGFSVEVSTSAPQALGWLERSWPELVVLNPRLPGGEHLSFKRLRACSDVPVVMINPLADDEERTWGLQLGADDYVPSPLCADELVARVRSVLRRVRPLPHPVTFDPTPAPLELDGASRRVRVGDAWIALTAIEFRLFAFLAAHPAHAFRREELLEAVWGYTVGDLGRERPGRLSGGGRVEGSEVAPGSRRPISFLLAERRSCSSASGLIITTGTSLQARRRWKLRRSPPGSRGLSTTSSGHDRSSQPSAWGALKTCASAGRASRLKLSAPSFNGQFLQKADKSAESDWGVDGAGEGAEVFGPPMTRRCRLDARLGRIQAGR